MGARCRWKPPIESCFRCSGQLHLDGCIAAMYGLTFDFRGGRDRSSARFFGPLSVGRLSRMETREQSDRPATRWLGHDICWLSLALSVLFVVTILAGEVFAASPVSSLVTDRVDIGNVSTLDVGSIILSEQERVILEPTLIGLVGAGRIFVSLRRRLRPSQRR